jgi:hypothetical protein
MAITLVVTKILNLVVHQCLLNWRRGYWLLYNVLFVALTIMGTTRRKYVHQVAIVPPLQCGEIDQEIKFCMEKWLLKSLMCCILF